MTFVNKNYTVTYEHVATNYGSALSDVTLNAAITAIGTSEETTLVVSPGTWALAADVTVPDNITLKVLRGAVLQVATTKTLTINGSLEAGLYQIFDCDVGGVIFGSGSADVYSASWFGLDDGGVVDNQPALTKAVAAVSLYGTLTIPIPTTSYALNSTLVINKSIRILGDGIVYKTNIGSVINGTKINWTGGSSPMITSESVHGVFIDNIVLDCAGVATYGWSANRLVHSGGSNLIIHNAATYCLYLWADTLVSSDNSDWNNFYNLMLSGSGLISLDSAVSIANSCHNAFYNIRGEFTGSYGIHLGNCDNNNFFNTFLFRSSGIGIGVYSAALARSNYFYHLQASMGGMKVADSDVITYGPLGNSDAGVVFGYDMSNSQPLPDVGEGAKLDYTLSGNNVQFGWKTGWRFKGFSHYDFPNNIKSYYYTDGIDGKITVPHNDNISFGHGTFDNKFSLEWVGLINVIDPSSNTPLISKYVTDKEYRIAVNPTGVVLFYLYDNSSGGYLLTSTLNGKSNLIEGENFHVVGTYDGSGVNTGINIYTNGEIDKLTYSGSGSYTAMESPVGFGDDLVIGNAGSLFLDGESRLARIWNIELSATEIEFLANGDSIPYKYIGASQTALTSGTLTIGKHYTIDTYVATDDFTNVGGVNISGTSFVATDDTPTDWSNGSSLRQTGCVLNLNPSGIGHNQWIDTSGNKIIGNVSGNALPCNIPTNHVEKYIDLTVTADTNFTVPSGYKITSIVLFNTTANAVTGGINIGLSSGAEEVVANFAMGASATVNCTLLQTFFSTTADDIIYIHAVTSWNSSSLEMYVQMEQLTI